LGDVFPFGKLKQEQSKIKQELDQREEEIKGGDGVDGDGDGVLDACMHQARSSIRG
jgi:hypothetical protein